MKLRRKKNKKESQNSININSINIINDKKEAKEKNGRILIHCYKGVSRSVSVLISYLIYLYKWTYDKAFDFVQLKRPVANPNIGFYLQLKTFHKRITLNTDRLEIFSVSHFSKSQYDLIVCRLIFNNINIKNDKDDEEENVINEEKNEKKEIILNIKGMFIFAMKENIFIVEGSNISDKNLNIYKNESIHYINDIRKYENLGENNISSDKIKIMKQNEFEEKYDELINDKLINENENNDYINKIEEIIQEINNEKNKGNKINNIQKFNSSNFPKKSFSKLNKEILNNKYNYKEYPRGWNSTKDYFVNNNSQSVKIEKSKTKIPNFP